MNEHIPGSGGGGGGTAVLDRPADSLPEVQDRDEQDGLRKHGRTIAAVIRASVTVGSSTITEEVEPKVDPAYERVPGTVRREAGRVVNANELTFRSSIDWEWPLTAFLLMDKGGTAIGRAPMPDPVRVPANTEITIPEGLAVFSPLEPGR